MDPNPGNHSANVFSLTRNHQPVDGKPLVEIMREGVENSTLRVFLNQHNQVKGTRLITLYHVWKVVALLLQNDVLFCQRLPTLDYSVIQYTSQNPLLPSDYAWAYGRCLQIACNLIKCGKEMDEQFE